VFDVSCVSVSCALVIGLENFPLRNHSLIAARSYVKPSVTESKKDIKYGDKNNKNGKIQSWGDIKKVCFIYA
jgi:hypothetical protein